MTDLQLGVNTQDVTPFFPVELAGFAHRKGATNQVYENIYVKTFLFKQGQQMVAVIVADYIWWDTAFVEKMRDEMERKYQIPKHHILFHATHNHSAPQTSARFSQQLGRCDAKYLTDVEEKVFASIHAALNDLEEVTVIAREGVSTIGINRRKKGQKHIEMAPNPKGSIDPTLKTFSFVNKAGKKKALWIHYTCHPTCTDVNIVSGEFPGRCCRELETIHPECTVAYLQGFCGDIRPKLIRDGQFYRGTLEDMDKIGEIFLQDVQQLLEKDGVACIETPFEVCEKEMPLTFQNEPLDVNIPDSLFEEWQNLVRQIRGDYSLKLQYIKISQGLELFACNGELVHEYGLFLKQQQQDVLPLGYSNGMVGYIPTAKQLEEGGYEAKESIFYFGYPNPLDIQLESTLKTQMKMIVRKEEDSYDTNHSSR